jgi:4-amino-4-deoxy-L-arabinose transferase-like glycosyltransferase
MKKDLVWLLLFVVAAILMRFFSFYPSVLDHDESTYMLIGDGLLQGKKLYSDITDTKPVGVFLLYAALQSLFGYSIFLKRIFAAVIVGLTCYLVKKASFKIFNDHFASVASAIIYLFYTSMWVYFGLSPNTELYFNFFTVSALLFFLDNGNRNFFIGGVLLGMGFMFKYLVLFDYVAFMLFFLVRDIRLSAKILKPSIIIPYVFSGIGFLLPFAATAFYFYTVGRFDDFYFITFVLPGQFRFSPSVLKYMETMGDFLLRFLPLSFFFFYVLIKKHKLFAKWHAPFFVFWIIAVLTAMYLPGKTSSHYAIQLMLPASIVAGVFFHSQIKIDRITAFLFRGKTGLAFLLLIVIVIQVASYHSNIAEPDDLKIVASYLEGELDEDDLLFVSNYEPAVYYLLQRESPTKYVHSSLLFTELHKAFKMDNVAEIRRIMDQDPKFVLVENKNKIVEAMMGERYYLDRTFRNDEVLVYRLK